MTHAEISGYKNIDMDKMISSITREINCFWSMYDPVGGESKMCLIHRVPEHIYEIDRVAYEPMVISFGPYHYGDPHLQDMEKHKWKHLDRVLKLNNKRTLHDYVKAITGLEKQVRKCYSEEIKMERKKLVQMLLLDGCFILVNIDENAGTRESEIREEKMTGESVSNLRELASGFGQIRRKEQENTTELELIKVDGSQERGRNTDVEDVNAGDWMGCCAWHDMFLLENQIPFWVVESICEIVAGQGARIESLRSKAAEVVADILRHYPAIQELDRPNHFHHLLHLCHLYLSPSPEIDEDYQHPQKLRYFQHLLHLGYRYFVVAHKSVDVKKNLDEQADCFQAGKLRTRWRRAVEYHRAGIRFRTREFDGHRRHSLLDIRFMDGVIEVPRLPIDEGTESLFKNLVALEQTDTCRFGNDISAYVTFMSQVVATPDDATMFVKRGIIVHMMDSDEEVSALFTRITKQVSFRFYGKYYLKSLCQTLEAHYQSRLNRWIAWLWLNHFGNPWLALAALAAGVVLVCTIIQTVYTVLAYVNPP